MNGCLKLVVIIFLCVVQTTDADTIDPRKPWTTSKVVGAPSPPAPYVAEIAFPNLKFKSPTSVMEVPGTSRLLVTEIGGKIHLFRKRRDVQETKIVADVAKIAGGGVALHSVMLHPEFATNRLVFVQHTHPDGKARVSRYKATKGNDFQLLEHTERVLLQWPAGGHGGGCMHFGTDGYLYISTGDGSGPAPPDGLTTGQDLTDLLGAVLRIDVDKTDRQKHYSVPSDNPFVNKKDIRPEIWSYGLRNPWKFGIDPKNGDIFVCDNGWETWEMVHKLHAGSNCGWPIMEGRVPLRTEVPRGPTPITPPVKDHPHTEANSVVGGPVYRGTAFSELNGTFIYGDYITGTIWGLKTEDGYTHTTLTDTDLHLVAFAEGSDGEIFFLDYDQTGMLYRLKKTTETDSSASFPRRLSETGLFSNTENLTPSDGVAPYSVVAEPWGDGASSRRWIAIPGNGRVKLGVSGEGNVFPDGTVLVKHLTIPRPDHQQGDLNIETQLMHYESGSWRPYAYLWDANGSDAFLVDPQGQDRSVQMTDDPKSYRTWHVGSTNECRLCHSSASGFVVGFSAKQLAIKSTSDSDLSQLRRLTQQHVIHQPDARLGDTNLVNPHDESAKLDSRARSYLHVNCGVCHNRQGPATISFFAHADYPYPDLRITKRPGIGRFGLESPRLIKAGDPFRSIILYRMSKLGYGRMPYIGSRVVDSSGVSLIREWVQSMPAKEEKSNLAISDSDAAQSLSALVEPAKGANDQSAVRVGKLLESTEGALALSTAMHMGKVDASHQPAIYQAVSDKHGDIRGLFDSFLPEYARRRTLGPNPDSTSILELTGDAKRGELIFLSDDNRCRSCHDPSDKSKSLGPTLAEIRAKFKDDEQVLPHIIHPSQQVDEKFATWVVLTDDGKTESGLKIVDSDAIVVLQRSDRTTVQIDKQKIESMDRSPQSIMPNGLLSDMTAQQAADLLAYLGGE